MNEIVSITNYEQLKRELTDELGRTANSFVRIGYLLKLARDNITILDGSGYADVNEFASKEYGLDKTQVSRFIRINDRFSLNGNSTQLLPEYAEYGSAKLSLMLTLPDEINEELSPEYSKSDIQAIKEDYEAEQKISPIEVALEETDPDAPDEFLECVVKQLNDEHAGPITYYHNTVMLAHKMNIEPGEVDIKEAYMPDGDKTYNIRIAGQGRFMVNMKDTGITIINMRDPSIKSPITWEEFHRLVMKDEASRNFKVPEKPKKQRPAEDPKSGRKSESRKVEKSKPIVAPVQPKEEPKEEIMPKPENATVATPEEKNDVLDKIQIDLIDELDKIKEFIERRSWRAARETAEDVANRIKHLGY